MSKFLDYSGLTYYNGKIQSEINQIIQSISGLSGKYYGFYTSSSQLPQGTQAGYAYVGSEQPFTIYNFNGSSWSNSGAEINVVKGEDGVGFQSVASQQDGTIVITLTDGNTITIDLNHDHPQYLKYVYLESISDMPQNPEATTLYLIKQAEDEE